MDELQVFELFVLVLSIVGVPLGLFLALLGGAMARDRRPGLASRGRQLRCIALALLAPLAVQWIVIALRYRANEQVETTIALGTVLSISPDTDGFVVQTRSEVLRLAGLLQPFTGRQVVLEERGGGRQQLCLAPEPQIERRCWIVIRREAALSAPGAASAAQRDRATP